jgi:threonine aldolase
MDERLRLCSNTGMDFRSDNTAGVAPSILAALTAANDGTASSYGADPITERITRRFCDLFEREVAVFPVATGTAANVLALAALTPPWGVVYCHEDAHIAVDECGAPEFYTGGAQLALLDGEHGKIAPGTISARVSGAGVVHHPQPAAISLSQASEAGTVYTPAEIGAIAEVARRHKLGLHVDGARFANALVSLGRTPAELTWRAGVDILSFGATKNGAMAAEAVIVFDPVRAGELGFRRKRGGHLFSKMRFLTAQLDAYLADGLWLANARHANTMATKLGGALADLPGAHLRHPVEANEVFVELPDAAIRALAAQGFGFHRWSNDTATCIRLVTSFATKPGDVDSFIAAAKRQLIRT